ncbi:MAG: valine--tRNA ligase [Gammaproteobacteria bacterium]|nr:valine--tRNA ligase [Gammaproteobacteria bacterium]
MEKTYNFTTIESHWCATWESKGYFKPSGQGESYCIMLPPPNVTGSLHMGHAFQQTLMDILIRYHRMQGHNTLWQCGTDHAGIATQMVVERQLEAQGKHRLDLGREQFVKAVWDWKETSGNTITRQSRRLGTSMDWSRERFTMDEGLSEAVTEVFVRLYEEGLIYRGKRLVNWDPVLHTAISDLEVVSNEEAGNLWHIRYPLKDDVQGRTSAAGGRMPGAAGKDYLVVATTRPETMLGDTAVAVNPDDERYRDLIGQQLILPLTGRTIPIIADNYVDPEFGTGCVKITPAHDFNDYAIGQRHNLPLINIFTIDAVINDNGPSAYRGMDRFAARKAVVADLTAAGLMEKVDAHTLMVPRGDRSQAVVEPYLTDQWYVKIQPLAEPAIKAVEDGRIRFVPENWSKTYFEWMRNIQDWCISRQLWWGHRIPAWYDELGNIYVGRSEAEIRAKHKLSDKIKLKQDEDVLDTWFSSALWPFSTLGWPQQTAELKTFYPSSVLITGFDIIFFWVARMIMLGLKFMNDVPFREVYITGLIRDEHGQKMSKSKGNILDPLDLIDGIDLETLIKKRTTGLMQPREAPKITAATRSQFPDGIQAYGTDAMRFTFAALASNTRDINFDTGRIGGYRNFCNKLWNATRYVMLSVDNAGLDLTAGDKTYGLAERWINTRLAQTITQVIEGMQAYRFDLAAQAIHEFTWDEYCDWYLELSKTTLTDQQAPEAAVRGTLYTLVNNLEVLLRLLHPFMPFITEELWQKLLPVLKQQQDTIMLQHYPAVTDLDTDPTTLDEIAWIKAFIIGVRRIRAERDIPPGKKLPVRVQGGNAVEQTWLERNRLYLLALARLESIATTASEPEDAAVALAGEMTLLVPLAELINFADELRKLEKELDRLDNERQRTADKLNNQNFIGRAPPAIVQKERDKLNEMTDAIGKLKAQYARIEKLKG